MKKPAALRAWLVQGLPELGSEAERLQLFVDRGRLVATRAPGPVGFEYRYTLNVVCQDFAGDEDALFVLLLVWLRTHQPDILDGRDAEGPPLQFVADNLGQDKVDLSIDLPLTEAVTTRPRDDGAFDIVHLDEPGDPMELMDGLEPGTDPPVLAQIYLGGVQLLPDTLLTPAPAGG